MLKKLFVAAAVATTVVSAPSVFAAEGAAIDYSQITSAIDMGAIATAILSVAAILAGIYSAITGSRLVLSFLRR